MSALDDIKTKLDELAVKMLDEAGKEATTLDRKLDIFKFVQSYYVGSQKLTDKRPPPSDPNAPTMEALRGQVAAAGAEEPQEEDDDDDASDSR